MPLEPVSLSLLIIAAFLAGVLNALAGGGSFLTLPALVFTGVPPVAANATGTAALLPGYLASAWACRDLIRAPAGLTLRGVILLGGVGGALGAFLLLATSDAAFGIIVPWLLLAATLLFALGPRLNRAMARRPGRPGGWGRAAVLGVCGYGGYFNGGMGIVMLAAFRLLGVEDLNAANGLKNLLSAVLTLIAVVIYALGGAVSWAQFPPMALAAVLGGLAGARLGRWLPPRVLHHGIVLVGAVTTLIFFLD